MFGLVVKDGMEWSGKCLCSIVWIGKNSMEWNGI
jgi:hypothetical protein